MYPHTLNQHQKVKESPSKNIFFPFNFFSALSIVLKPNSSVKIFVAGKDVLNLNFFPYNFLLTCKIFFKNVTIFLFFYESVTYYKKSETPQIKTVNAKKRVKNKKFLIFIIL